MSPNDKLVVSGSQDKTAKVGRAAFIQYTSPQLKKQTNIEMVLLNCSYGRLVMVLCWESSKVIDVVYGV